MRLILHNPHAQIVVGRTVLDFLLRVFSYKKYQYILDYLEKENKDFAIYLDKQDSSLPPFVARFVPAKLEVYLWAILNNVNIFRLKILTNINRIEKDDIFLSFSLRYLDREYHGIDNIADAEFIKVFHVTHFVQNTTLIADNCQRLKVDFLIAENNLSQNSAFFRKIFSFYKKDVYLLPFVFQNRFKKIKNFFERKNKCIATGTLVKINNSGNLKQYDDFYNFYKVDNLQPVRKMIYENKDQLNEFIDSYIGELSEKKIKEQNQGGKLRRFINKIHNFFALTRRKYFKFNIVEKYNDYKMFINGEEINDLPGIGFVEGMACGSAYLGQKDHMYEDLGLIGGQHYIVHDGSVEGIESIIGYYQNNPILLEKIADEGHAYVNEKFNGHIVAERFWEDLEILSKKYKENNYSKEGLSFDCSFLQK